MIRQTIQFTKTSDNVRLAYGISGSGPILVKCANWLNHLEFDWESPVWRHWFEFFSRHFTLIRYDERGCGLSDWNCVECNFDKWVEDLEQVVIANELERFPLLGISQGAAVAIEYAHRHPEQVSHLILFGGFATGRGKREDDLERKKQNLLMSVIETGWDAQTPAFRQFFASLFVPNGSREHQDWFSELCLRTANTHNAMRIQSIGAAIDVREKLASLRVPTLVLHAQDDAVVPHAAGKYLASEIPGARFVTLASANHLLLAEEPAWHQFCSEVEHFLQTAQRMEPAGELTMLEALTRKERQILDLLGQGLSNSGIAEKVFLSEKTIRNHLTTIYDKLRVSSRAEAIVLMRSITS